jgi:ABC-type multidrug transport system ATPase subunit
VRKRFGNQEALRGIDLVVPHGQRVAIVGPNGSGKSTLLRVVMGLVACEGEIRIDALSPFADRQALARLMAYVPQVAPQLGATVGELVRAVTTLRELSPDRVLATARRLELDTTLVRDKPFRSLSGGMKHKLLLALALSADASLLILDEPSASLDVASRQKFEALLDEVAKDATVLLCSHRIEEVQRQAERIVELGDGRIVRDLATVPPAGNVVMLRPASGAAEDTG